MAKAIRKVQSGTGMEFKWGDSLEIYCCDCGMAHTHYYEQTADGFRLTMFEKPRLTASRRYHYDALRLKAGVGQWQMKRKDGSPSSTATFSATG